ncbi:hypothetical protein [Bradyrhizobium prioriisuperbiae]|uniref:hypothetical protein n=1 Tax=Bradyrhizobium prioriisuperbiae TaxID=2854389 RepID=UPI0038993246
MRRSIPLTFVLLAGFLGGSTQVWADSEPTRDDCVTAVEQARALTAELPADDLSRYFAERDLHQAMVEAGNGEFDDCLEAAARATVEMRERRHTLQPGETLKVLQAHE